MLEASELLTDYHHCYCDDIDLMNLESGLCNPCKVNETYEKWRKLRGASTPGGALGEGE